MPVGYEVVLGNGGNGGNAGAGGNGNGGTGGAGGIGGTGGNGGDAEPGERKSVEEGKRVELGGSRFIKKKNPLDNSRVSAPSFYPPQKRNTY